MAFGERERSSLFAFARTRLLRIEPSVLSVCLGKLYGREGKKKKEELAGGKKLILAPRSCSQNISGNGNGGRGRRGGREEGIARS